MHVLVGGGVIYLFLSLSVAAHAYEWSLQLQAGWWISCVVPGAASGYRGGSRHLGLAVHAFPAPA